MKRLMYFAISVLLAPACEAQAVRGLADVSIIDRDSGVVLDTHYYHGDYWVAGRPGGRYAIEIHNQLGERLLAVTSVDGVNVVSGETAAWDQGGYVFDPGDRYQITGWRKSDAEVAAFTFTDLANSYAARTGRPANIGVIGVAVFRERQPPTLQSLGRCPRGFGRFELGGVRADVSTVRVSRPGAQGKTRHGSRRTRILVRRSHRIPAPAETTEPGHPHPL
jgi:hypothetical protein